MWQVMPGLTGKKRLSVAVVGVGGTGSEVISALVQLHQALVADGREGLLVHAFDPDTVSAANLVRQRYHAADLRRNKAEVLIRRVNAACGLDWQAHSVKFAGHTARSSWDIVLSCVDTRAARKFLHRAAFASGMRSWGLWMDFGNDRDFGQVILGTPRNERNRLVNPLPCATELHPALMDTAEPEDDTPSCSALEALAKQELTVNKMVATLGLDVLWQALWHKELRHHGWYFNLKTGVMSSLPVPTKVARASRKHKAA